MTFITSNFSISKITSLIIFSLQTVPKLPSREPNQTVLLSKLLFFLCVSIWIISIDLPLLSLIKKNIFPIIKIIGIWDSNIHTAIFKIDNQGPTV